MLRSLYRPPLVGILAFVTVIAAQPLGHSMLMVIRGLFHDSLAMEALASMLFGAVGFAIVWLSLHKQETSATWLGFIGGVIIWVGFFEFSWDFFARLLNVQPVLAEDGSGLMSPGIQMIQASGFALLVMLLFYYANRETRCNAFRWIHRFTHMNPGKANPGKDRNYGLITAIETVVVIWTLYVINITIVDPRIFGDHHPFTYAVFFGFLVWSVYLNYRLFKFARMAPAVRYAIPTTVITWLCVEMLSRWGLMTEIWIHPFDYAFEMTLVLAGFALAGVVIYLTPERGAEKAAQ
jgi:hypothetical protein